MFRLVRIVDTISSSGVLKNKIGHVPFSHNVSGCILQSLAGYSNKANASHTKSSSVNASSTSINKDNNRQSKKNKKPVIPHLPINEHIRAINIRLVDSDGKQIGIMSRVEALQRAKEENLDLVPVSSKFNEPQICKLLDYGRHLYSLKKKMSANKKVSSPVVVKEVKLGVTIEENDLQLKMKQMTSFLEKGNHVRIKVAWGRGKFRFLNQGKDTLDRVLKSFADFTVADGEPQQNLSSLIVTLRPKKNGS